MKNYLVKYRETMAKNNFFQKVRVVVWLLLEASLLFLSELKLALIIGAIFLIYIFLETIFLTN